jgi:hypothetical protein
MNYKKFSKFSPSTYMATTNPSHGTKATFKTNK